MACTAVRSPADQDRFICIYPAYLNNKKTIVEGRRIPISKAVENPTATEIQDVCSAVGLNVFLEKNKMYSREWNPLLFTTSNVYCFYRTSGFKGDIPCCGICTE
uniref:Signal recognition particle 19 kDa protein n=1 Tax=Prolemur simus TaxID=1328070 RepID=A0A8C8YSK2_PROSS